MHIVLQDRVFAMGLLATALHCSGVLNLDCHGVTGNGFALLRCVESSPMYLHTVIWSQITRSSKNEACKGLHPAWLHLIKGCCFALARAAQNTISLSPNADGDAQALESRSRVKVAAQGTGEPVQGVRLAVLTVVLLSNLMVCWMCVNVVGCISSYFASKMSSNWIVRSPLGCLVHDFCFK